MTEFSEESMADLGRALMAAIETHVPGGWSPMDCPSEIVGDLVEELGELRADAERYQKLRDEETWGDDSAAGGGSRWAILGELSGAAFDAFVDAMPDCPMHGDKDAKRFRWLLERWWFGNDSGVDFGSALTEDEVRATIDAAMLKTPNVNVTGAARHERKTKP